jgi:glutathione S-transferase
MKLYDIPISPNCRVVRIAARELGLPLELVPVNPRAGENRTADYLAQNPMGKVPTLLDGDFALWESAAIVLYLCGKAPGHGLYPSEPRAQAEIHRWAFFNASHVKPHVFTVMFERVMKAMFGMGAPDQNLIAHAEKELKRFLPVLDQRLAKSEYLVGDYSAADVLVGAVIERCAPAQIDLAPYPALGAWLARVTARPAWKE